MRCIYSAFWTGQETVEDKKMVHTTTEDLDLWNDILLQYAMHDFDCQSLSCGKDDWSYPLGLWRLQMKDPVMYKFSLDFIVGKGQHSKGGSVPVRGVGLGYILLTKQATDDAQMMLWFSPCRPGISCFPAFNTTGMFVAWRLNIRRASGSKPWHVSMCANVLKQPLIQTLSIRHKM